MVRGHGQTAPSVLKINTAMKSQNIPIKTAIPNCIRTEGIPERKRGFWVGALSPWCHCPHESGGTLPLLGDAAQPLRLTPRMAGVATAHPLLSRKPPGMTKHRKTKEERREGGTANNRKTGSDAPRWELELALRPDHLRTTSCWASVWVTRPLWALTSLGRVWPL